MHPLITRHFGKGLGLKRLYHCYQRGQSAHAPTHRHPTFGKYLKTFRASIRYESNDFATGLAFADLDPKARRQLRVGDATLAIVAG